MEVMAAMEVLTAAVAGDKERKEENEGGALEIRRRRGTHGTVFVFFFPFFFF